MAKKEANGNTGRDADRGALSLGGRLAAELPAKLNHCGTLARNSQADSIRFELPEESASK